MSENNYISGHIRRVYARRLVSPVLYLILLIILWLAFPMYNILFPRTLAAADDLNIYTDHHSSYVETTLSDLYFTGYTGSFLGRTSSYYYYCMRNGRCTIVLLSPSTCEEGLPFIESVHIRGRVMEGTPDFHTLLEHLAKDLNWTEKGIKEKVNSCFISEPAFGLIPGAVLVLVCFSTGAYTLFRILLDLLYIRFPVFAPACRQLGRFGKPGELLAQAETELATLPQLATEDMFITEHYFIVLANYGAAVIPIQEMLWIYKHSTLHKILWHHFSISYTLHVTARKHLYFQCPKNMKSDIDGIMDYLAEANHDILVGFSEENRLKVHGASPYPPQIEKILSFMRKIRKSKPQNPENS